MIQDLRIGITGGNGLIGKALRKSISGNVKVLLRSSSEESFHKDESLIVGNFADPEIIPKFVKDLDVLIHAAAAIGPRSQFEMDFLKNDFIGTIELAKSFFSENPNGHFIFLSTAGGLYDLKNSDTKTEESDIFPDNLYGAIKYMVESSLENLGNVTILRPSAIYGDSFKKNQMSGLIDKLLKSTLPESEPVNIFDRMQSARDYLHVDDLVEAIKSLLNFKALSRYEIFNVGTGVETSISEVIQLVESMGLKVNVNILPVSHDRTSLIVNSDKLRNATGWKPRVTMQDGILRMSRDLNI